MKRNDEMRKEKRIEKQKGKKGKEKRNKRETVRREKREEKEKEGKGKRKISRLSGCRGSTVRGLKLEHAVGSTCGHQKVGVSTNSKW